LVQKSCKISVVICCASIHWSSVIPYPNHLTLDCDFPVLGAVRNSRTFSISYRSSYTGPGLMSSLCGN
jgi:hypothetical protein